MINFNKIDVKISVNWSFERSLRHLNCDNVLKVPE